MFSMIATDISSVMNNGLTLGERLMEGFKTTILGMGTVFAILILLWGVLVIFGKVFRKKPSKVTEIDDETETETITETITEAIIESAKTTENDDELIAVITAAISACLEQESGEVAVGGFRVVSFRKATTKQAWNKLNNK